MARPIIALLTDFGLRDHYVASMKGALLGICRDASVVDITHEIPAHDVRAASETLAATYQDFPGGTIFVVVVDPGVGSARRAIAAQAGGCFFVAPDNGVLTGVLAQTPASAVVELARGQYARAAISNTFEGRDRFAPAGAWLANGVALEQLGAAVPPEALERLPLAAPASSAREIGGEVVRVDRFGNLITNIDRRIVDALSAAHDVRVTIANVAVPMVRTYADVPAGTLCALFGSTNHVEIAANRASAAARLGLAAGARVVISPARD